eukprot:715420-Amorphochlora_amoeboformis.AAC.2
MFMTHTQTCCLGHGCLDAVTGSLCSAATNEGADSGGEGLWKNISCLSDLKVSSNDYLGCNSLFS